MAPPRDTRLTVSPLVLRTIALLSALALGGCTEQQFQEFMLMLAVGFAIAIAVSICMGIINLTILGGGIATLAINLVGSPTERSRVWGFVFGGLNVATGVLGLVAVVGGATYLAQSPPLLPEVAPDTSTPEPGLSDDFLERQLPTFIVMGLMSIGSFALGAAGIAVAARAKVAAPGSPASSQSPPPAPPPT